ncbi:MAG: transglutaminase family protein [Pseudomonadota bacterium]|nr:transglutaminase family protein [Pseudomonadota bacterium]
MKLLINHQTTYRYDRLVRRSVQYLRLTPQTLGHQRILNWQLAAPGSTHTQPDGFGNIWTTLSMSQPHQDLLIMVQGEVDIDEQATCIQDDRLPVELFLTETDLTEADDALKAFSAEHLKRPDRSGLIELSQALIEKMPYTPGTTNVMTKAADAFALGRGVCQDHTHVFLACVRAQSIPARYVSGYLYTSNATHLASHAWAEVWLDGAWYCFDVSNQMFTPKQHVQLAVGRDYLDAAPVRGMRQGGGNESMDALVQVMPSV